MNGAGDYPTYGGGGGGSSGGIKNPLEEDLLCDTFQITGASAMQADVGTFEEASINDIFSGYVAANVVVGTLQVWSSDIDGTDITATGTLAGANVVATNSFSTSTVNATSGNFVGEVKANSLDCGLITNTMTKSSSGLKLRKNLSLIEPVDADYLSLQATLEGGLKLGDSTGIWVNIMPIWQDYWAADCTTMTSTAYFRNIWSNIISGAAQSSDIDVPIYTRQYSKLAGKIVKANWFQAGTDSRFSPTTVRVVDENDITLGTFTIPLGQTSGSITTIIHVPENEAYGVRFHSGSTSIDKLVVTLVFHAYAKPPPPAPFIPPSPPLLSSTPTSKRSSSKLVDSQEKKKHRSN